MSEQANSVQINYFKRVTSLFPFRYIFNDLDDVVLGDYSSNWKAMRKIFVKSINMYGAGLDYVESTTQSIMQTFVDQLDKQNGQPVDLKYSLTKVVASIASSIVSIFLSLGRPIRSEFKILHEYVNCIIITFLSHLPK